MMLQDQKPPKAPPRKGIPLISFYDKELVNGVSSSHVSLLIRVVMENINVQRVFIDQVSSFIIMYFDLLGKMQFTHKELSPYNGGDL